jgi:hypothetical protein
MSIDGRRRQTQSGSMEEVKFNEWMNIRQIRRGIGIDPAFQKSLQPATCNREKH